MVCILAGVRVSGVGVWEVRKRKGSIRMFSTSERRKAELEKVKYADYLILKSAKTESTPYDDIFRNCENMSDWWSRLLTTQARTLFLDGHPLGPSRICEFQIAVALEAEWAPTAGSDVRKIIEYTHGPEIVTVEVRHSHWLSGEKENRWVMRTTDSNGVLNADFVVGLILPEDYNPCYGYLFCFPRIHSEKYSHRISISRNRNNRQKRNLNEHWQYEVSDYLELEQRIWRYCNWGEPQWTNQEWSVQDGDDVILEQMELWDLTLNKTGFVQGQ
jgi:hypothetical protein